MFLPHDLTKLEKFNDIPSDMISIVNKTGAVSKV